jgi:predicted nucleic acid-binding protein
VPDAVYEEVVTQGIGRPGCVETDRAVAEGWMVRRTVQNRLSVEALLADLDTGEAETIILAKELGVERVLIDDRAGRARAHQMGLMVTGTVGLLMLAKRADPSIDLRRELDTLIECNFRIAPVLYERIAGQERQL